ncbi:MAG: hypothetical protein IPM88_13845 [Nitrospira sp.]|nr:hypothetical protein [Nitrospira sp.]
MDLSFDVILGAWIATGLTLFILSFLYEDNPLFKLAEHLYVGVSLGYTIVKTYDTVVMTLILRPILDKGEWSLLIPVAIGMLMLTRYVPKAAWLSRYAFAFIVGIGAGLAIPRTISSFILKQIEDTVRPLLAVAPGGGITFDYSLLNPASHVNAIIILIGVVSVLFYFFFSVEHSGPGKAVARRHPLSDDLLRRSLRVYRHGPHVAPDRPPDGPDRILRRLLWTPHTLARPLDRRHPHRAEPARERPSAETVGTGLAPGAVVRRSYLVVRSERRIFSPHERPFTFHV